MSNSGDQGLLAAANRFPVRHPFPWMARRQANAGRLDRRQHVCPKDLGHRFLVDLFSDAASGRTADAIAAPPLPTMIAFYLSRAMAAGAALREHRQPCAG
ncbi:hypothetical protein [Accumulibacter sp.]|uniref:Uncharacterized protein n=1 Tax=Candidatus Accumulibacter proximus TaxID=2954385 RepID=A0A935PXV1_9PROT|nr:hypothetical protein [Accumulibacter sp.]MBK7674282.1 hypothetical protein [Candidatus Accumulibacter proximus]MBL8373412.1 hypothetical protein [Accumulibacter sp.]